MEIGVSNMKGSRPSGWSRLRLSLKPLSIAVVLFSLFACGFPEVKESAIKPDDVMDFVDRNYDSFIITYCGEKTLPNAILFDPRNDGVALTGNGWYLVENKAQVNEMIRHMITAYRYYPDYYHGPYLFEIQSKEGGTIGYYYSVYGNLTIWQDGNNYRVNPLTESDVRDEKKFYSIKGAGYN
jgi:hypothetical protein